MKGRHAVRFINLTDHAVHVIRMDGSRLRIDPSGEILRYRERLEPCAELNGIDVYHIVGGTYVMIHATSGISTAGLPPKIDGTLYIVSKICLQSMNIDRNDFVSPGQAVKDSVGNVIGCKGFLRYSPFLER